MKDLEKLEKEVDRSILNLKVKWMVIGLVIGSIITSIVWFQLV